LRPWLKSIAAPRLEGLCSARYLGQHCLRGGWLAQRHIVKHNKFGYGFLLPWPYEVQGGVNHVILGLVNQCLEDTSCRPIALENNWTFVAPQEDVWRGITRNRLRLRSPWSGKHPLRAVISYILHLPGLLHRLRQICKRHNLRVINIHVPGIEALTIVAMRCLGLFSGKTVFTFHGSEVRIVLRSRGLERKLWKWTFRGADSLVFVSEGLRTEFLAFDPTLSSRAVVVYNGVDAGSFIDKSKQAIPYPDFFGSSHRIVLSVAAFEYRKGHDLLIEAFETVLQQHSNARLAIVGDRGPTLDATRKFVADRGLDRYAALLTDIPYDRIPGLLRRADVFVLSSRWEKGKFGEGFPLVLVECGALARPVVSTESTGCNEIIKDGETGRLVPLGDSSAIANAIVGLLNNQADAERIGYNLQKLVFEQFTWRHAWQKYRALISA
jgi:glycosyltransferase involved in cell wall biosynthesis